MKIYVKANGITLVGKAWEIRSKLRQYCNTYDTIEQWTKSVHPEHPSKQ